MSGFEATLTVSQVRMLPNFGAEAVQTLRESPLPAWHDQLNASKL
jgi:hypothetical protein